jgi:hypothetical protein
VEEEQVSVPGGPHVHLNPRQPRCHGGLDGGDRVLGAAAVKTPMRDNIHNLMIGLRASHIVYAQLVFVNAS